LMLIPCQKPLLWLRRSWTKVLIYSTEQFKVIRTCTLKMTSHQCYLRL
jgi:hypothetical protein